MICNGVALLLGVFIFILLSVYILIKERNNIFKCRYHSIDPLEYDDED